jgi:hypothetical protein
MSTNVRYLPAVRQLPDRTTVSNDSAAPRRLLRLGNALAVASVALVGGGLGLWHTFGAGDATGDRGPWPLLLAAAFGLGLVGAGCCLIALVVGNVSRREVVSALCISLVAPLAVGIIALALFFASTSLDWGL